MLEINGLDYRLGPKGPRLKMDGIAWPKGQYLLLGNAQAPELRAFLELLQGSRKTQQGQILWEGSQSLAHRRWAFQHLYSDFDFGPEKTVMKVLRFWARLEGLRPWAAHRLEEWGLGPNRKMEQLGEEQKWALQIVLGLQRGVSWYLLERPFAQLSPAEAWPILQLLELAKKQHYGLLLWSSQSDSQALFGPEKQWLWRKGQLLPLSTLPPEQAIFDRQNYPD